MFTVPERGVMQFGFCWSEPPLEPDASALVYVIAPRPLPWLGQPDAILE